MFYNSGQFADFLKTEVKAAIKEFFAEKGSSLFSTKSLPDHSRYLTRSQVATYLGIAVSTVDYWARIGKLNKIDLSGSPRFDKSEIDANINTFRKYNRPNTTYSL